MYQNTKGKHTKYINMLYTPDGMLKIDNPISGFMIILPIVMPTVPFWMPDSIATVTDCCLLI